MRGVQTALLTAILVALCVIGWQLNRIADFAAAGVPVTAAATIPTSARIETRAERNKRLQREMADAIEDGRAIMATPIPPAAKPHQSTPAPVR